MRRTPDARPVKAGTTPPTQACQDEGDEQGWDQHEPKRHDVLPPAGGARSDQAADRHQGAGLRDEKCERKAEPTATRLPEEEHPGGRNDETDADLDQPVQARKEVRRDQAHRPYDGGDDGCLRSSGDRNRDETRGERYSRAGSLVGSGQDGSSTGWGAVSGSSTILTVRISRPKFITLPPRNLPLRASGREAPSTARPEPDISWPGLRRSPR